MENSFDMTGNANLRRGFSRGFVSISGVLLTVSFISNYFSDTEGSNQQSSQLENLTQNELFIEKPSSVIGPYKFERTINNPKTYNVNPFEYGR